MQTLLRYIANFLENAPFHGLYNLVRSRIHWTEFVFWIITIICTTIHSIYLGTDLVFHYQTKNAIITMDTSYMLFNTTTPAITFCPHTILDKLKVANYISKLKLPPSVKPEQYTLFLHQLARTNIGNLQKFRHLNYNIAPNDYMQLIFNLSKDCMLRANKERPTKVMTDMGICYTFNSDIAATSTEYWGDTSSSSSPLKFNVSFATSNFPRSINFKNKYPMVSTYDHNISDFNVYKHAPNEIITTWTREAVKMQGRGFTATQIKLLEIVHNEEFISDTTISQRGCRTPLESNLQMFPATYSRNLCLMDCRAQHALNLCQCLPHFYGNTALHRTRKHPICNIIGLNCLSQYEKILRNLHGASGRPFNCSCLPNCAELEVYSKLELEIFLKPDESPSNKLYINVALEYPPLTQYKRSISFTKEDFAVSIGNVLAVFLGCSLLSFLDILYYFTIRIFWFRRGYRGTVATDM